MGERDSIPCLSGRGIGQDQQRQIMDCDSQNRQEVKKPYQYQLVEAGQHVLGPLHTIDGDKRHFHAPVRESPRLWPIPRTGFSAVRMTLGKNGFKLSLGED